MISFILLKISISKHFDDVTGNGLILSLDDDSNYLIENSLFHFLYSDSALTFAGIGKNKILNISACTFSHIYGNYLLKFED